MDVNDGVGRRLSIIDANFINPHILREILQPHQGGTCISQLQLGPATSVLDPQGIVQVLRSNRQFTMLYFDRFGELEQGDAVAQGIGRFLRLRSNLKTLMFVKSLSESGIVAICKALERNCSIETLLIDGCGHYSDFSVVRDGILSEAAAMALARCVETNTSLETLFLHFSQINASEALTMLNVLVSNTSLKDVDLCGIEANGQVLSAISRLVSENNSLISLGLKRSSYPSAPVETQDFVPWIKALTSNKSLEMIILSQWNFRAPHLKIVVDALIANDTIQTIAYLDNQLITDTMVEVCRLVTDRRKTRALDLSNNSIGNGQLLERLCTALLSHQDGNGRLEELKLGNNDIGDAGVVHLARLLQGNCHLKRLYLNGHCMTNQGFKALGKALSCSKLKFLSLETSDSEVTLQGIQDLVNGVKNNMELTELKLNRPELLAQRVGGELDVYLERNRVLTPLLKADPPLGLWPLIMKRTGLCHESPDLLFSLVKEKCDLFRSSFPMTRARKRRRTRR